MGAQDDDAFALICACLAWPPSPARDARVRAAAASVAPERAASMAKRHRVQGLVAAAMRDADVPVPPAIAAAARRIALRGLQLGAETVRLQRQLSDAGIAILLLKGSALGQLLHGSPALRHAKDIDILIAPDDVRAAWAVLDAAGYRRTAPDRDLTPQVLRAYQRHAKDSVHFHPESKIELELHWRMSDAGSATGLPPEAQWRDVTIGSGLTIRTMTDAPLFAYLCTHGAAQGWARLKWLADIAAMLGNAPDGGASLWGAACAQGAARNAASAILLANELLGTPLPPGFASPRSTRLALIQRVSHRMLAPYPDDIEPGDMAWRPWIFSATTILAAGNGAARWAALWRMLVPGEDVALLRLPRGLGFVYPLARGPLWLWKRRRRAAAPTR